VGPVVAAAGWAEAWVAERLIRAAPQIMDDASSRSRVELLVKV
jgi:hypothetical protein